MGHGVINVLKTRDEKVGTYLTENLLLTNDITKAKQFVDDTDNLDAIEFMKNNGVDSDEFDIVRI